MNQVDKDPTECSLFYLAMKKKRILLGLWKTVTSHPEKRKMVEFLSNDFTDEKWKTAALKNAYVLLGKQRFRNISLIFRIRCCLLFTRWKIKRCCHCLLEKFKRFATCFDCM